MNILCLLVYVSAAVIMDLQSYKVSNRLIIAGLLTGCILQMMKGGWSGLVFCMSGVLLPLIILWPVFLLHILGAGDVKLFSVIGSMMGPRFVLTSMLYAIFLGGIQALIVLLFGKAARKRIENDFKYSVFPFTISILAAVLLLILEVVDY